MNSLSEIGEKVFKSNIQLISSDLGPSLGGSGA